MPFFPWKCSDCGVGGAVRHKKDATRHQIITAAGKVHAQKSPQCHAKETQRQMAILSVNGITPRDKHVLISARIKRKLMADALRQMRAADPVGCRKQFMETRKLRKGYAFT